MGSAEGDIVVQMSGFVGIERVAIVGVLGEPEAAVHDHQEAVAVFGEAAASLHGQRAPRGSSEA